ncbi:MAG: glycosyltransferase [Muribaculaceae bacterium]|nr:glycosyltransferase [Muribaculaceae bacterium]
MKTLLQINTNVGWNAPGILCESIGRAAINDGWQSVIAYGRDMVNPTHSASHLLKIGTRQDILIHGILSRFGDHHGHGSVNPTKDLIRHIEILSPDIIHLHNIHGYYLNYELLFSYLSTISTPVVWSLHDCWPITGHCAYFSTARCSRWRYGCHSCPLKAEYPSSWIFDRSHRNYESRRRSFTSMPQMHIVTVSDWLRDTVRQSFLQKYNVSTIYNFIPTQSLESSVNEEPTVIAAASRWETRKGLRHIATMRKILPPYIRIRVAGLSRRQIAALPSGIEGLPRLNDRESLLRLYSSASVFVNTSEAESLSTVNIEAQSCGTPVVAFGSGGMPETVNPFTGIIVPPGNIYAMCEAVRYILSHPFKYSAEACQNFVRTRFSYENTLAKYIELYYSLISGTCL